MFLTLMILVVGLAVGRSFARAQQAEPVSGLQGRLGAAGGQAYAFTLTTDDGLVYALLGASPAEEALLGTLLLGTDPVEVSGTLQRVTPLATIPLIVVDTVRALGVTSTPPPATLVSTPAPPSTLATVRPTARPTLTLGGTAAVRPSPQGTPEPTQPGEVGRATAAATLRATAAPVTATRTATPRAPTATATPVLTPTAILGTRAAVRVFALNLRKGPASD
ncbi:MAG: hypothetical protein ACRC1H_18240, partial [Caldilineaceae bacterium]